MKNSDTSTWEDLPPPILELIVDLLPLTDYLRFPAVCTSWRDVQHDHRLCHAASPRFHLQMPWLIYSKDTQTTISIDSSKRLFYNPSEHRFYRIPLPQSQYKYEATKHGWLLLVDNKLQSLLLVNPFTSSQIKIHLPATFFHFPGTMGDLSSPPTDPDCVLLYQFKAIGDQWEHFLYQFRDKTWSRLFYPLMGNTIACAGKFYGLLQDQGTDLVEVDPGRAPVVRNISMFVVDPMSMVILGCKKTCILVECDGHVLLSLFFWTQPMDVMKFHVYKADLCHKVWERIESLGDHVLFLCYRGNSFSVPADRVQCPRNRIYLNFNQGPVVEYDYSSHQAVEHHRKGMGMHASKWILPSLC